MHPRAIAEEVGLSVEQVRAALDELESPDPESRSPECDGKRIIRLDEHRSWGWVVVNYTKYRAIRDEDDRREQNRLAQQRWRAKYKLESGAISRVSQDKPEKAHTEAEAEALNTSLLPQACTFPPEKSELVLVESNPDKPGLPHCPHKAILSLWAEVLPAFPQHNVELWNGTRAAHLRSRWRETAAFKGWRNEPDGIAYMRKLFAYIGQSRFLSGRVPAINGRPQFIAELAWVVNPTNWAKIHEGKYHQEEKSA
jgi:hypothetical protein